MLRKRMTLSLLGLLLLLAFIPACTGQPKPLPPADETPGAETPGAANDQQLMPTIDMDELISLVVRHEKVEDAAGVIADIFSTQKANTVALVGVTLTADTSPEEAPALLDEIRQQIKAADPLITTTVITTDAALVTAIRRMADGINGDEPINEIINDLFVVVRSTVSPDLPKNQPNVQPNAVTEVNPNQVR